ncbi:MAG: type II secretion system protein [Solibacillus sp.]|uniref:type II secretion system protein n=1 Tax=unclassified Solibacillus TaxID=2637870 RepID=UPI0030F4C2A0
MSERGFSFVESLLAVVILFFLTTTLIPITVSMRQEMALQKIQTNAAEVAFNGALSYSRYGEVEGEQVIDDTLFTWSYSGGSICVTYLVDEDVIEKCV